MKYYLSARSDEFDFFGIIDLDAPMRCRLKCLLSRFVVLQAEEPELQSMSFWDSIDWYEYGHTSVPEGSGDKIAELVLDNDVVRLPDDFVMPDDCTVARTECDKLLISADGFWWECYPKHCDRKVHSCLVQWKALDNG